MLALVILRRGVIIADSLLDLESMGLVHDWNLSLVWLHIVHAQPGVVEVLRSGTWVLGWEEVLLR